MIALAAAVLVGGGLWAGIAISGSQREVKPGPGIPAAPPPPPALPESPIDLAGWKLSIPAENHKGNATTIQPAAPTAPWLTEVPGGGLMFWAPSRGATTKHSNHPRTELDSLTNFSAGTGVHTLMASVTLLQAPQDGRGIILGQIHGAADISSVPYVMLRFQDGQIKVVVKQVRDGDEHLTYPLLSGMQLNSEFSFTITDPGNGALAFSATHDGQTAQATAPIPAEFEGQTVRFQAGDYQQANNAGGVDDGGRVVFRRLVEQSGTP